MTPSLAELVEKIEALYEKAAKGPWRASEYCAEIIAGEYPKPEMVIYDEGGHSEDDAALIVALHNAWPVIKAEIERLSKDAERLDFVQAQSKGYGRGWICRQSITGRGIRLCETSHEGAKSTVREAIDAAIAGERE